MGALAAHRRRLALSLVVLVGAAVLVGLLTGAVPLRTRPAAVAYPVPVYEIEARSGSCTPILNSRIGYVGAPQVPVPVDVDCDLLPDVTVAVNLVDLEGPVNDPLATDSTDYDDFLRDRANRTLAPNVEINRYPLDALATILGRPSPPLRINVKLRVKDLELQKPDTVLRFGYDTGEGGSIPTHFKAVVRGMRDFFNPLEAVVDTKGDLQGGDTVPSYYEGPLTLVGGVATSDGDLDARIDTAWSPFPDVVQVGYASDQDGHHIDYAHGVGEQILLRYGTAMPDGTFERYVPGELPEVDLSAKLDLLTGVRGTRTTVAATAEVDRLPRRLGLDLATTATGGRLDYDATTDGRLPDARLDLISTTEDMREKTVLGTTRVKAHVEDLPAALHGRWHLGEGNDMRGLFTTADPDAEGFGPAALGSGPGIGALEVLYADVPAAEATIEPFVAAEQQFLNLQAAGAERLVTGRMENIRGLDFATRADGVDVVSRVGDGAQPLQLHVDLDGLPDAGPLVDATAVVAPLPGEMDVNLFTPPEAAAAGTPFRVVYRASETVDVDGRAEVREAGRAGAECGEPGTLCADLGVRHLPARLEVAVSESGPEQGPGSTTDVAVDAVPRPGAPRPDVFVDAVLGKDDSLSDPDAVADAGPVILEANALLRAIPETVRLRFVEGADETLERLDFATCELTADARCPAGTPTVGRAEVQVRNFRDAERGDADVPHPSSVAPQFATLTARGLDDPEKTDDPTVRFEASARARDITEVRYANVNGLFGVRSVVGDSRDLEVLLDVENVIFGGNDPTTGPVDLKGRALVSPLPAEIDLCLREAGFPLTLADQASFTDRCETTDPFGDASVAESPLTFSYDASSAFDLEATVDFKARGLAPGAEDDHDIAGRLVADDIPADLTAHILSPPEREEGAPPPAGPERLRIRTIAPGASGTDLDFGFEERFAGATCRDPEPAGDITCVSGTVAELPDYASIVADSGPDDDTRARVFACDLVVATDACRPGTAGQIADMTARLRMVTGDPVDEGDLVPFVFPEHPYVKGNTPEDSYLLALRLDQDDSDDKELRAEGRLASFRSLSFDRSGAGFDIRTDLGDGKAPLLGSIGIDTRVPASAPPPPPGDEPATGQLVRADTRIDPLPQVVTISQHGPGDDQAADPLNIRYTSTSPVRVDARAEIFGQVAGPLCGDHGTMCATLGLDRLPTEIEARISTVDHALPETAEATDVRRQLAVDIDAIPFGSVAAPDIVLDAALGTTPTGQAPFDDTPIVAHGELHGFSERVRLRLSQVGTLLADDSLEDGAFEEVLFTTCELVEGSDPPACAGPEFPIREIALAARNFHLRPTDFPVPQNTSVPQRDAADPAASDPMYAEAVARGEQFEAHAGFTSVREFRMSNVDDVLGVKVGGGDGQAFSAHGDLAGITLPDRDLEGAAYERRTLALDADVSLSAVPTEFAFCMRQSGAPIKPLSGDFTEPCENQHPFSDDFFQAEAPESAPMSIAYRANAPIAKIVTSAVAQIHRVKVIPFLFDILVPQPTMHVAGDVTIDNLPERLTAHIETPVDKEDRVAPVEEGGAIRAYFFYDDSPSIDAGAPPVDITFAAEYRLGDAVCRDLRDGQVAFCLSGKLENLPSNVKAYVDPEAPLFREGSTGLVQNLRVLTNNSDPTKKLNLRDIDVSVVKDDDPDPAAKPLVLVAEGDILGLPTRVDGTIHMPDDDPAAFDKPAFDITASPPLDEVDLVVRNFVAPDPLPAVAPARNGVSPDQSITFLQRGDFFKAEAHIDDVAGGGYRTGRNAAGQATETQLLRVDFGIPGAGPKPTIRGYVDLLTDDEAGNPTHVFADALLDDMPHGLDICFRGELPAPADRDHDLTPAPGTAGFCDLVPDHLGGFRFKGRTTGDPEPELDVDAIFRMTKGSDTNVLKAVATVRNIPNVVEGTFGDGAVSVSSFRADGTTPNGIDDVVAEMADFDFAADGYGASPPWGVRVPGTVVLPPAQPGPAHEYARVATNGADFHVKAHIGTAHDGTEGARITKFVMDPTPCPQPGGAASYFPHFPAVAGNEYTCIRGELESHSSHPLLLDADLLLDGTPLKILDAGLSEVPQWFQATIAKTPTLEATNGAPDAFRRRCGTDAAERAAAAAAGSTEPRNCMPPLLHFDSEGNAQLFGRLHIGGASDLHSLAGTGPQATMADLEALPVPLSVRPSADPDPWAGFSGAKGVRVKLGDWPADPAVPGSQERKAVRAGFRLQVPQALTVDQVQKWSFKDTSSDSLFREASDLRFHFVMRDAPASGSTPVIVDVAGELAAMIHDFSGGGQTLVSHVSNDQRGIPIPGEFGLDLFDRDYKGRGRHLIQADLRTSADLGARVRLVAGADASLGDSDFRIKNLKGVPAGDASYTTNPEKPSFRLRAELKDPADKVVPDPPEESDWKDDLLCLVWCIATDVGAPKLRADLDLAPNASEPVRLVEAVVNQVSDTKLGAEIKTFADIEGTEPAEFSADNPSNTAVNPFAFGGVHVDLDPFNFFLHAGIPVLASFDLLMLGEMNVDLDIGSTDRFVLRMDTTKIRSASSGADASLVDLGSDTWLQVSEDPGVLAGFASLFWPFPPVYLWYSMGLAPTIPFTFHQCPTPAHSGPVPWTMPILPVERDVTAFLPFTGPIQVVRAGPLQPILDPVFILGGPPIMCALFDTGGIPLHSGQAPSHTGDRTPGDPMVIAGHPVAGLGVTAAPGASSGGTETTATPSELTVASGTTVSLCGTHVFSKVTVEANATLNVATAASDAPGTDFVECPPDTPATADAPAQLNVGRLNLVSTGDLVVHGKVNGPTGGDLSMTGSLLWLRTGGEVDVRQGFVQLNGKDRLIVDGLVDADGVSTGMPARADNGAAWAGSSTGNAGASHGGAGNTGTGAGGGVGPVYGSGVTDDIDPGTEAGSRGGSPDGNTVGGDGGGTVALRGSDVLITGTVQARGLEGEDEFGGACSVPDNPGTEANEAIPNSGEAAGGGGSGGGVAVHGVTVNVTGFIRAGGGSGGEGRAGAGGGGGGGVIRLNAGDVDHDGDALSAGGGLGGFSLCTADFGNGQTGADGVVEITETPQSHANPTDRFWYHPDDVRIPYRAAAAKIDGILWFDSNDFTVYLCGVHRGPEAVEDGANFGLEMPAGERPSSAHPCGTRTDAQPAHAAPQVLATVTHAGVEVSPALAAFDPAGTLDAGVWGLWTVSSKPDPASPSVCFPFYPVYDNCTFEDNPVAPEAVIGVDPNDPTFSVAPVATTTNLAGEAVTQTSAVTLALSSVIDQLPRSDGAGSVDVSGIDHVSCFVDDGSLAAQACARTGDNLTLDLPGGEGRYVVYVVAVDQAGNTSAPMAGGLPDVARFDDATGDHFDDDRVAVVYDKTAPATGTAAITAPAAPTGQNGWYTAPPTQYRIDGFDDGAHGSGQHPEGGFQYRFDGADWVSCTAPCVIEAPIVLPGAGSHTLSWKARDGAALESAVSSIPILVDGTAPETAVDEVPTFDGTWITAAHPLVVARGLDEFGGSGVGTSTDPALCDGDGSTGAGLSGTCISLTGAAGPYQPYTGPVELPAGENQVVCAFSVDVAGNTETPAAGTPSCTEPLDVDNLLPTGAVTVAPPAPTGNPPWYDGDAPLPTITFSGYDGTGSPAPAGGGFRYRVDNSGEWACGDPCSVDPALLSAGSKVLHWTVVDSAGNRRPEQEVDLFVDRDDPRSQVLVDAPVPDGANGWHLSRPVVRLVGFDEPLGSLRLRPVGSGVAALRYTLDGGSAQVYSGPFFVGPGDHQLCVWASDVAGNDGPRHCHRVAVDEHDPAASVLQNGSLVPVNDGDNGWYRLNPVTVTTVAGDAVPGSGVVPQALTAALCDHTGDGDPAPAGVCISVDGRAPGGGIDGPEFGPYTGAVQLGEGEHVIRAFSVDNAGRRSAVDREVVKVDRSDPVTVARLRAPHASRTGLLRPWWRHQPTLVLRALDGDHNAGVRRIEYRIAGGAVAEYTAPVTMPVGIHSVEHRAVDESGRVGPWRRLEVAVDLAPPTVKATKPNPSLWLYVKLLNIITFGPEKAKLQWQLSDDLSGKVKVRVIVYSAAGLAVRHLDGGTVDVTPGVTKDGFTYWDGKDDSLLGFVPAGVYYYRVVATDDAGNVAMSGESERLQIKLKL